MQWEQLLSLKRQGDTHKRIRSEQDETRLGFEVDYDRVIFSAAFRSLQDKTQVIPLSKTSFVHTRLTHSLEVSVVGRSLGRAVGKALLERHPQLQKTHGYQFHDFGAIVAAAALAHDIGNPPFGHSGEKAIGDFFSSGSGMRFKNRLSAKEYQDLCDFEGNANGFKILTETKNGVEGGLRLSYATLGAFTKYPKESLPKKPSHQVSDKKFGVFQNEVPFFAEVADTLGLLKKEANRYCRHPLAFLVEAADDICYTLIDFEDGINLGLIEEEFALEYLVNLVRDKLQSKKYSQLTQASDRLAYLRSLAISTLIEEAVILFLEHEEALLNGTFSVPLLEKCAYKAQIDDILKISIEKIYQSREVIEKEIAGYKVLGTLLEVITEALERKANGTARHYDRLILRKCGVGFQNDPKACYSYLMDACHYISQLTDGNALQWHQMIQGKP
ncbi:MAG TPA: dNTP triphosphohydrolase [Flavobacteriaceae bacterium]|nr:dNTP triphosphohydrolase [Flavobacteriaceae bacterium]MCB9212192.1 dNTP triphosphohydrolase [Alteromonas sp.]HPF10430.1 dNTP triphosphohydrolase [Flavobacteriaceae bacterium]HQU20494.1 dNTP triphosphohydrolase [Flavobacteriaceae bacterium]HQU64641.1 dNTP triphosphohydrolase [Flavobacteriaceae bacterium]